MLRFTPEQNALLINQRQAFNVSQTLLAERFGATLIGNASVLPRDVWGQWDREAIELQRTSLVIFNDLAASVAKPMPIGKMVSYFQTISDSGEANISMDGRSKARTDQPEMDYHGTPLPIIDSTFSYGWRQIEAARTEGYQLDAAGRLNANRKVRESLENIATSGSAKIKVGADGLYGLTNHPSRLTRTTGQALNGATGAEWMAEFKAVLALLHDKNFRTNITIYVNWSDWFYATSTDYSSQYPNKTIAQRLLELDGLVNVVGADSLPAGTIIGIVKDRSVVEVLNGMPISTRPQFRANPEDDYNFVTMAASAVQLKFDAEGNMGLAHSSL